MKRWYSEPYLSMAQLTAPDMYVADIWQFYLFCTFDSSLVFTRAIINHLMAET